MSRLFAFVASFCLASCTAIPVSSLWALSRIDFETTKIEQLRVAVELPNVIEAREGGVHLEIGYTLGDLADKMVFRLAEDTAQIGMRGLLPFPADGKHIKAYRLRDEDVAKLNKVRGDVTAGKQKGKQGSLTLGISAKEFCRRGDLNDKDLAVTTFVASSETKGYVVLLKDFDLRSDKQVSDSLATLPECTLTTGLSLTSHHLQPQ